MTPPVRVLVTGAAGQLAYSIVYMIARGDVFGPRQTMILVLLDLPEKLKVLEGLKMELSDCTLPLLNEILITTEVPVAFKQVQCIFLIGAIPRQPGMLRKDLLTLNVKIFKEQGQAINQYASKNVKVLIIGNPCNTLAYICQKFAPSIPATNFASIARLDLNRATAQLANRMKVPVSSISNLIVWGNHGGSQVADATNAICNINGCITKVPQALNDPEYLTGALVNNVAERGTKLMSARKLSSAVSAAKAACDQMRDWWNDTPPGQFTCMSVISDGSYGTPMDVFFSFPVTIKNREWSIVQGLTLTDFVKQRIAINGQELINERKEALSHLKI